MEGATCDICFTVYSDDACVPKVLECGHTICLKCLKNFLKDQKICPNCRKTLTKSLDEYPTNFIVLNNNKTISKENYQEMNILTDKVKLLLSKKETFKNSIEERMSSLKSELVTSTEQKLSSLKNEFVTTSEESISSLKNEITGRVENFEKLIHEEFELSDAIERRELMEEINRHSEVKKKFHCSCYQKERIMLQLSQYKNEKHFLYDLVVRLQNDEKIYSCELIGVDGWRYGEITFSENRIHIHCLSSDTIGNDVFVVSLRDLRKCFGSKENLLPFILIGDQKLIFTLTENLTFETLRLIKLFTGEGGQTLKGIEVDVDKDYPEKNDESGNNSSDSFDFNNCQIPLPTAINETGYEDALYEDRSYEMNKDDVILQNLKSEIHIYKVSELESDEDVFSNVVGKLHKDFQIDFEKMRNKKVEDSGICFSL